MKIKILENARALMLPLQQADICTATLKRNISEWLELPAIYWLHVFLLEEELVSKEVF